MQLNIFSNKKDLEKAIGCLTVVFIFGGIGELTPSYGWVIWLLGVGLALGLWIDRVPDDSEPKCVPMKPDVAILLSVCAIIDIIIALSIGHILFTHGVNSTGVGLALLNIGVWAVAHDLLLRSYYRIYCYKDVPYFRYTDLTMSSHAQRLIRQRR